ncbi:MAG: response regulator [Nannocystaceae bacterium]
MKLKLLIADDDATTRRILNRAIALLGHEVVSVNDGKALVERFSEVSPDLVLTDWRMPEMDGVEAIQRIRALPGGADVFIVLSTGVYGAPETANAIEAGADDYILKPISVPALRVLLMLSGERIVRRRSLARRGTAVAGGISLPAAVEHFPGLLVATDLRGRVRGVNRAGAEQWRLCEGAELTELFLAADRPALRRALSLASEGESSTFLHHSGPDGDCCPQRGSVWPLHEGGEIAGCGFCSISVADADEDGLSGDQANAS